MHEAFQVHSVITHKVECLAAYNDTLLVGTRQGHLIMYNLERKDPKPKLTLMKYSKSFSKKPIQQLEIIPDHDILLSLTDNVVELHGITANKFTSLTTIQRSRGATLFAVDTQKIISSTGSNKYFIRLAIAVKKKIQIYYFMDTGKKPDFLQYREDIVLTDIPKSMVWCQNVLCLGYRDEYALLEISGETKHINLFPTSSAKSADPCILLIADTHLALCRENQTVLVNSSGETEKNKALKWSEVPIYMAYDEPYTLGVLTDCIEVCILEPSMSVQILTDMPNVRTLVRACPGILFAASLSQVWCVMAVDIAKQLEQLLLVKQFQLALSLAQVSSESEEEKQTTKDKIQTRWALDLFEKKQFAESMREFLKLDTDPYDVIQLYPEMLPQSDDIPHKSKDLTDKEMQDSILALSEYLTEMRHRIQDPKTSCNSRNSIKEKPNNTNHQLLQIIDTTLIKCYVQTKDALVPSVIRMGFCHLMETEKLLKKHNKSDFLVILYQSNGQHKKALELLKSEKSIDQTVEYLQNLGSNNMELVLEFSEWVLTESPEDGIKIFIEDVSEAENLSRSRVLDTLLKSRPELAILYLEHVIHNWEEENPSFHNTLIDQYRKKILKEDPIPAKNTRKKLLTFLEQSTHYIAEYILKDFTTDSWIEERALIVGRLGKHDQAIALYIRALGDVEKAERYCERVFEKGEFENSNVYAILVHLVLKPDNLPLSLPGLKLSPKTAQPNLDLALQLLEKHASKINPVQVLAMLPDDIPVSRIHQFLSIAMQKAAQERRRVELLKGLLFAEHLQCQEMKLNLQSQHVLVLESSVCPACKRRFGNRSALVRYPNGDVVHLACQERK